MARQGDSGEAVPTVIDLDHPDADAADDGRGGPRVIDLDRAAIPGPPPMPGAQWDELRSRWERWNIVRGVWQLIDREGSRFRVVPRPRLIPAYLAREIHRAELAAAKGTRVLDVDRLAPTPQVVRRAQWNEVAGRWEQWDEDASVWVEALAEHDAEV